MKKLIISLFLSTMTSSFVAQSCHLDSVTTLSSDVLETSGLIYFEGKLITHNDSGGSASLYEIDVNTGSVTRTVTINNASNIDWEDIAQDDDNIYIGDFGNNNGTRSDLRIYIISKADFNLQTIVSADTIQFQYTEQIDFTSHPKDTDFDCEAMVVVNDTILLFTKNWVNEKTNLYKLPILPGFYNTTISDSLNVQGTVTGATYNAEKNTIFLVGYQSASPFMWELAQFSGTNAFSGTNNRCGLVQPTGTSIQIEAITNIGNNRYYLSSEEFNYGNFQLPSSLSIFTKEYTAINESSIEKTNIFPNPTKEILNIKLNSNLDFNSTSITIYSIIGHKLYEVNNITNLLTKIDISELAKGSYFVSITSKESKKTFTFIKN